MVLEIIEGPDAGKQFAFNGPMEVGRDPSCEINLTDDLVSRVHARLRVQNGSAVVEDLESTNGTFLNGLQLHAETPFNPGDHLLLGVTVIELRTVEDVHHRPTAMRPRPAALGVPERRPDYVRPEIVTPQAVHRRGQIDALLDVRTKRQARMAPLGIVLLVAIAIILFLALR